MASSVPTLMVMVTVMVTTMRGIAGGFEPAAQGNAVATSQHANDERGQ
ncbi:MAG: hypothetical protein KAR80_08045 [Rhodospirillaceae bacterium]|nr:hypothetical protein [Rhodospirillaceae bacterium]